MNKNEIRRLCDLVEYAYAEDIISHHTATMLLYENNYSIYGARQRVEQWRDKHFGKGKVEAPTVRFKVGGNVWQVIYNALHAYYMTGEFSFSDARSMIDFIEPDVADHGHVVADWREERDRAKRELKLAALPEPRQVHWRKFLDTLRELYMYGEIDMDTALACIDPEHTDSAIICDLTGSWESEKEELAMLKKKVRDDFGHWEEYMEDQSDE